MRASIFVALVIGSLLAPIALVLSILKFAPLPYERMGPVGTAIPPTDRQLADQFFPKVPVRPLEQWGEAKPAASAEARFDDGTRAIVAAFPDELSAALALDGALTGNSEFVISRSTHALRYERASGHRRDGGGEVHILAWVEDNWLYWIDAPSHGALDARIAQLGFVRLIPGPRSFAEGLLREDFPMLVAFFLSYLALLAPLWARAASWAGSVEALERKAGAVNGKEMERRLRALDVPGGPFVVEEDEWFLFIGWRADDPALLAPLTDGEQETVLRLRLLIHEGDHTVRARDESAVIEWDEDPPGVSEPTLDYATERGVMVFEPRSAPPPGVKIEAGDPKIEPGHPRRYDEAELRGAVVAVVTQSGWRYRPVLSFRSRTLFG